MDETTADALVDELIAKANSHLEDAALRINDAMENLENLEVLGAIGALSGCEEVLNRANMPLLIARDYAEKLARARAAVAVGKSEAEKSASSEASGSAGVPQANPDPAIEVVLPDAEFDALPELVLIAPGTSSTARPAKPTTHSLPFRSTVRRSSVTTAMRCSASLKPRMRITKRVWLSITLSWKK